MTDILQEIQQAETVSQLGALMYRAETAEEHAAICLREAQILGTPLFIDATEEAAPHPLDMTRETAMRIETQEQLRRTVQALAETDGLIAKERAYSAALQKGDYLAGLECHAEKLIGLIKSYQS